MVKFRIGTLIAAAAIALVTGFGMTKTTLYNYEPEDKILHNPYIGFAPMAKYEGTVGDNTLVYVELTWRDFEPEEGKYDFDSIWRDNNLKRWKKEGKKVVFRFVCDSPDDEKHMDIPDWLYKKTKDGSFYDISYGKGYAPHYENKKMIAAHAKAIKALGEEFGKDDFFCYIELGSLGHWGEWHVKYDDGIERFPTEETARAYVEPYVEAFPNAKLLMRRPFSFVKDYSMGVYNDMTGAKKDTKEWLNWIEKGGVYDEPKSKYALKSEKNIWNHAPVGGEFTSSMSWDTMLRKNLSQTVEYISKSHMSFIGPHTLRANVEALNYKEAARKISDCLGYRYAVKEVKTSVNSQIGYLAINVTLSNNGTAPIYFERIPYLYLYNEDGKEIEKKKLDINLETLYGGESKQAKLTFLGFQWRNFKGSAAIAIEDPKTGKPDIALDMKNSSKDKKYTLFTLE